MSGRLVLVRHGQSVSNVDRRLDTRPPGRELTDLGREQARAFAKDWRHDIGMVAHSVALRASQTAAEYLPRTLAVYLAVPGTNDPWKNTTTGKPFAGAPPSGSS